MTTKKDAYYFSHDMNARNDLKIMALRQVHGMEGYGIYWSLIEMLREQKDHVLSLENMAFIAYDLRQEKTVIEKVINDYDLFTIEDGNFFSQRLLNSMDERKSMSDRLIEAGRKGGLSRARNACLSESQAPSSNKGKESKGKESKEKEKKELPKSGCDSSEKDAGKTKKQTREEKRLDWINSFNQFWEKYPPRNGKKLEKTATHEAYLDIHEKHYPDIWKAVNYYANDIEIKKGIGIKDPKRFLKKDFWREYLEPPVTASGNNGNVPTYEEKLEYNSERQRQERFMIMQTEGYIHRFGDTETWTSNYGKTEEEVTDKHRELDKNRRALDMKHELTAEEKARWYKANPYQ
jgi:hypothetical protein